MDCTHFISNELTWRHVKWPAAFSTMSRQNSYLAWILLPQSRCTPGSETLVCCRSCRSHRCTDLSDSPPGCRSCPLHGLAAVNIHKKWRIISLHCWTGTWMTFPDVARLILTVGLWRDWSTAKRSDLQQSKLHNFDFVNWQLHLTGKYSVPCLPTGHEYPVGILAWTITTQKGGKVVKCSRHTNNTYFVVSTARGPENIKKVLLLKLWFLFVRGKCLSRALFWQSQPFGCMSLTDELFLDNLQC